MATVLTKEDLLGASGTKTEVITSAQEEGGLKGVNGQLKEIQQLASTVESILSKIGSMRKGTQMQEPEVKGIQIEQMPTKRAQIEQALNSSHEKQPSGGQEVSSVPPNVPPRKLDRSKVIFYLNKLATEDCEKLPQEIKDMKIGDLLGKKWPDFSYNYKGVIPIGSDVIIQKIADVLIMDVEKLYE